MKHVERQGSPANGTAEKRRRGYSARYEMFTPSRLALVSQAQTSERKQAPGKSARGRWGKSGCTTLPLVPRS